MTISTSGLDQNSYITITEANAILLLCNASFMDAGHQLSINGDDDAYLLEAARDLDYLWAWAGYRATNEQTMQWPRVRVPKPGQRIPCEPGWYDEGTIWGGTHNWGTGIQLDPWLLYKIDFLSGNPAFQMLDSTIVPQEIKEAQALIALLRKKGGNLISDDQDNAQGMVLPGGLKIAYVNALKQAADIHKRTAQFGQFVGTGIIGSPA